MADGDDAGRDDGMADAEGTMEDPDIAALRSRPPGADDENPYADIDISTLPQWWQRAIEEFDSYGLRPYRPPRFEDGVFKHRVVERLEAEEDVRIDFIGVNSRYQDDWQVRVDGELVGPIGRRRSPEGFTVFEMDSDAFATFVRKAIDGDGERGA